MVSLHSSALCRSDSNRQLPMDVIARVARSQVSLFGPTIARVARSQVSPFGQTTASVARLQESPDRKCRSATGRGNSPLKQWLESHFGLHLHHVDRFRRECLINPVTNYFLNNYNWVVTEDIITAILRGRSLMLRGQNQVFGSLSTKTVQ